MARVVCQVLARSDRLTFIWSEGKASFEPYHLKGQEVTDFQRLAGQARVQLHQLTEGAEHDTVRRVGQELARTGHQLYRRLFRADEADNTAREVQDWLTGLRDHGAIESLDIVGDSTGLIPWNVVFDGAPDGGEAGWQAFWGVRYNLSSTRRVNALRQVTVLQQPSVLLVIDPRLRAALPESQQKRLRDFVEANSLPVAESLGQLASTLREQTPDLLYLFCQAQNGSFVLGDTDLTPAELEDLLRRENSGDVSWNSLLLFLNVCRGADGDGWDAACAKLHALGLSGLIVPEQPLPAQLASTFGLDFLTNFLYAGELLGKQLHKLRIREAPLGMLYSTACPGHLRVSWQEDADAESAPADQPALPPLPDDPYRPLMPYDREDRALFVGRDKDITAVAELVDAPTSRIVLLHGRVAVGKSSLLRAGVLPYLEDDSIGYRSLSDRAEEDDATEQAPALSIRATNDLPGQLALALCAFCARPYTYITPTERSVTVDLPGILEAARGVKARLATVRTAVQARPSGPPPLAAAGETSSPVVANDPDVLRDALCTDPALFGRLLTALAERLPWEPVLLIEQGEELFTLVETREDADNRRDALEMLRRLAGTSGLGKVLVSLRTEYYGRLVTHLRQGGQGLEGVRDYFLAELNEEQMVAAILQPTVDEPIPCSGEIPFEKYKFVYEEGVAEDIARQARAAARDGHNAPLPLLQGTCALLVERVQGRDDRTILAGDLKAIGGVAKALDRYVESRLERLLPAKAERGRFRLLLAELYLAQPDGTVTRDLLPEDKLARDWTGSTPLPALLDAAAADDVRLLDISWLGREGEETRHVSLGHDSLAFLAARGEREEEIRSKVVRKATIDWLWIVIPLLTLVGAFGWNYYRTRVSPSEDKDLPPVEEITNKDMKIQLPKLRETIAGQLPPLYFGQISLAAQAWEHGNLSRCRQLLLSQREDGLSGLRGFEWYYLWQLLHQSRHTLQGHAGPVAAVALSPDGKVLASGGWDGVIKLWSASNGEEQATLRGHAGAVYAVAFSGDGKLLASGGEDKNVRLWDVAGNKPPTKEDAKEKTVLAGHTGPVLTVAFTADGKTVASAGEDKTIKLWDVAERKERETLKDHAGPVLALSFTSDSKVLASAGQDQSVCVWDAGSGKKQHTLKRHGGPVYAVAFSPDGKTLASGGVQPEGELEAGSLRLWDVASGKEQSEAVAQPAAVLALAFSADGKTCAAAGKDNLIRLRDVASAKETNVYKGHLGWVCSLAVSTDGKTLASASYDGTVKLWDAVLARDVLSGHKDWVNAVAFSPDDKLIASAGRDGTIKLWDAATGQEVGQLKGEQGPVQALAFAPAGSKRLLASGHGSAEKEGGQVVVWELGKENKGTVKHTLKKHSQGVTSVAFSPDGNLLASASADQTVMLWDVDKGEFKRTLSGHKGWVRCVAFAPDGKTLASGGSDTSIRLWDPHTGELRTTILKGKKSEKEVPLLLEGHTSDVTSVAFSPDGKEVLSSSFDQTVRRWDANSGKEVTAMRGHRGKVFSTVFSPKGETIASGGEDGTVRVWDTLRGEQRFTFTGHRGSVRGVAFSSDRRILASAGHDGSVRLWRAAQEEPPPLVQPQEPEPPPEPPPQ